MIALSTYLLATAACAPGDITIIGGGTIIGEGDDAPDAAPDSPSNVPETLATAYSVTVTPQVSNANIGLGTTTRHDVTVT